MINKLCLGLTGVAVFISTSCYSGTMGDVQNNVTPRGGWVVGGDIGYGYLSTQEEEILAPVPITTPRTPEIQNQNHQVGSLVGGGYLGYGFPVFERLLMGLEGGYKYLGQSRYNSHSLDQVFGNFLSNNIKVNQQAVDLLLTGHFYVHPKISFIGKVGAAYVRSQTKDQSDFLLGGSRGGLFTDAVIWRIKPEVSLGVGYSVNSSIDLNLIFTHIGGIDANVDGAHRFYSFLPDRLPAVFEYNALTVGLSYTFG